jgi:hypothetical protein
VKNSKPYVAAAVCCERVLQEKDGVLSAIRIVELLTVPELPSNAPPGATLLPYPLTLLVALKSGDFVGESRVSLIVESPDGKRTPFPESWPFVFSGGDQGINILANFALPPDKPGLYWFEVLSNDEVLTKVPFKLVRGGATALNPSKLQ